MTDEEMPADKGDDWKLANQLNFTPWSIGAVALEAMHDRDRYMAERDMWREEAERLRWRLISTGTQWWVRNIGDLKPTPAQ